MKGKIMRIWIVLFLVFTLSSCVTLQHGRFNAGMEKLSNQEYSESYKLLLPVAEDDDYQFTSAAKYAVADMLIQGKGVNRNPGRAIPFLETVAKTGDKSWSENAMFLLVQFYSGDFGDPPNPGKKTYWEGILDK